MRIKTDERRSGILRVARGLFREKGFERTSMAAIAAALGGSKGTLYGYFRSKEELFAAVMVDAMEERGYEIAALLDGEGDLRTKLERFGVAYLGFLGSPDVVANSRTAIGAAMSSDLGARLYELGPRRFWDDEVGAALARHAESGALRDSDAGQIALHLQGLLEAGYAEPLLFGAAPSRTPAETVRAAVDVFLSYYGCEGVTASPSSGE